MLAASNVGDYEIEVVDPSRLHRAMPLRRTFEL